MILEIVWVGYKILAITCGLLLLYIACLLYKDEKDKIQDRLEFWWIKIYEYREGGFSAVTGILLFLGPVYLGVRLDLFGPWGSMLIFLGLGNSIAALFGLSVLFASLLLLLKRVVFPVVERILYFIAAENIINKRKSLVTAALILISSAWPEFGALLKELI